MASQNGNELSHSFGRDDDRAPYLCTKLAKLLHVVDGALPVGDEDIRFFMFGPQMRPTHHIVAAHNARHLDFCSAPKPQPTYRQAASLFFFLCFCSRIDSLRPFSSTSLVFEFYSFFLQQKLEGETTMHKRECSLLRYGIRWRWREKEGEGRREILARHHLFIERNTCVETQTQYPKHSDRITDCFIQ